MVEECEPKVSNKELDHSLRAGQHAAPACLLLLCSCSCSCCSCSCSCCSCSCFCCSHKVYTSFHHPSTCRTQAARYIIPLFPLPSPPPPPPALQPTFYPFPCTLHKRIPLALPLALHQRMPELQTAAAAAGAAANSDAAVAPESASVLTLADDVRSLRHSVFTRHCSQSACLSR